MNLENLRFVFSAFGFLFWLDGLYLLADTAKRRGLPGWPFVAGAVLLSACLRYPLTPWLQSMGIDTRYGILPILASYWTSLGLVFVLLLFLGAWRGTEPSPWMCPICRTDNSPRDLRCNCGYETD